MFLALSEVGAKIVVDPTALREPEVEERSVENYREADSPCAYGRKTFPAGLLRHQAPNNGDDSKQHAKHWNERHASDYEREGSKFFGDRKSTRLNSSH